MIALNFGQYPFRFKQELNQRYIFDIIRKKYVVLTPEEWVRQHILHYLCNDLQYPKGLISVEKEIKINNLKKRYDIVVYDGEHKPWMLIECKEPQVQITDQTLQQLLRYQNILQCPYWLLTNGAQHFCASVDSTGLVRWLDALPAYNS
ncbi:MAG: type I restriction enzyme HsdR N-terminal domain-containing protein [Sphingobacteriales bacterium]|nr:MAG: type I restriction enzyme HsdR N-terminal domain-containing protein [Sphingobacteriales bacterium]